jgi:hypothetical protein
MPRGRPKGSKTKVPTNAYKKRNQRIKRKFGADCYKRWGKKGGNPVLLKSRRAK